MNNGALTVTQLNNYIKALMDSDDLLSSVAIRGEISNFKLHSSGHMYFTLKDEGSEIAAVMFRGRASTLTFRPQSGMRVTVYGQVTVYEATGKYQIYVNTMVNDGAGAMYEQYMRLLAKLKAEGLFAAERKKPLPKFPKRIGIVTSPTGAAVRDMINVTGRRFSGAELVISPALVQGVDAPADLCRALTLLDTAGDCDVIIIGRGGGSAEDLWAFNDEALVRTVAACNTPIISAVGHETDTTLCDYAADMRAPTPSAAAEMAVPDSTALLRLVDERSETIEGRMRDTLAGYFNRVESMSARLEALSPTARLEKDRDRVRAAAEMIETKMRAELERKRLMLSAAVGRLEEVNPLAVLRRGYGMTLDKEGHVVSSVNTLSVGDKVTVRLSDGSVSAVVEDIKQR